jgi:RNA polymerase sigma-70 factor (ECF subfamily)
VIGRSFLDGLDPAARECFAAELAATTTLLENQLSEARTAWPAVNVAAEHFAAELARRLGPTATLDSLTRTCTSDVYLAIACADGDQTALEQFEQAFIREVDIAAKRVRATDDQAADVRANIRRLLFIDEPDHPAAMRDFVGRGNLRAYVRVMATRALIRAIKRGRRETPMGDGEILEKLALPNDPELSLLRAEYRGVVAEAMRAAVAGIDERTRALLRYQLVDKWTVDQVGRVYGVHRATAARWIAAARGTIGDRIRTELASRLSIDEAEVASIIRLVQSRVDVSLDRLLGPAHAETVALDPA